MRPEESTAQSIPTELELPPELRAHYGSWSWAIVLLVFALFFVADTLEHDVLPQLHIIHSEWFLTTIVATVLSLVLSRLVLQKLERSHNSLALQNLQLQIQAEKLSLQTERLALAVQEAHHRIKNSLQTVAALLTWRGEHLALDEDAREILTDSVSRIHAIAAVHDLLTHHEHMTLVNVANVVRKLTASAGASIVARDHTELNIELQDILLPSQKCTSVALIVNELVLNALEHAFPDGRQGKILVSIHEQQDEITLTVSDNGIGLPSTFSLCKDMKTGLDIASSLTEADLKGKLRLFTSTGTTAEVIFRRPIDEREFESCIDM